MNLIYIFAKNVPLGIPRISCADCKHESSEDDEDGESDDEHNAASRDVTHKMIPIPNLKYK